MVSADRPERRHRHEFRLHEAAGGVFRVVERAVERCAVLGGHLGEDDLLIRTLQILDQVDGVVGVELADCRGDRVRRQRRHEFVAHLLVELGQRLDIETSAERRDQLNSLGRLQRFDEIGEIGGMQVLCLGPHALVVAPARADRQRCLPARRICRRAG